MPPLRSRSSTRSPISDVPYDVLREIFLHCLPRHPFEIPQPNTTVAPMLLCQICSSWRTIALASPSLWSHLFYRTNAKFFDLGSWAFAQKEIDFILWWKRNQGSIAPFLCLELTVDDVNQELPLAEDGLAVLIEYVTSAQYLQVEPPFWDCDGIQAKEIEIGDEIVFPNLHTLVTYRPEGYIEVGHSHSAAQVLVWLALTHTPSLIRRLTVHNDGLPDKTIIPGHWSALTHLSMCDLVIPIDFWFSLIRTVTNLQWAYIHFEGIYDTGKYTKPSAKYTLPQLSTLFIACDLKHGDPIEFPLTLIFSTLYLPILHTLSLSSWSDSWLDHRAIHEVHAVLRSTPAVTTLALREYWFLSLHLDDFPTILAAIGDVKPIWDHVPRLAHLQLNFKYFNRDVDHGGEMLNPFVRNILLSNRSWLALDNIACPIKSMTLITSEMRWNPRSKDIWNLITSSLQKHAGGASRVIFKIIFSSKGDNNTGAETWKEWGSRNY